MMEEMAPRLMAMLRGKKSPPRNVMKKTAASALVERRTILICGMLMRDRPTKITIVARLALGMNWTSGPRRSMLRIMKIPLMMLERGVAALLVKFRMDRVREPETGMPELKALAILATPMLSMF